MELVIISVKRRAVTELDFNKHQALPEISNEFGGRAERGLGLPPEGGELHRKCLVVPSLVVVDSAIFSMLERLFPLHSGDYALDFSYF